MISLSYLFFQKCFGNYPLNEVDDVVHSGVAGDPLVQICDNVHADVTQEVLGLLSLGGLGGGGEDQEGGDQLHHHGGELLTLRGCEILSNVHVNSDIFYLRQMSFLSVYDTTYVLADMCWVRVSAHCSGQARLKIELSPP